MGKKYTWKKIPWNDRQQDEHLIEMGCPHPGTPQYYSYLCEANGHIQQQRCAGLNSSLNTRGKRFYKYVQHYSIDQRCDEAQEALCVRTPHIASACIVTVHNIGECPLCNYHTDEEYREDVDRRHPR